MVGAYVTAVALSVSGGWPARMLFDGFSPPNAYAWVSPPPDRAANNQRPRSARRTVGLTAEGSSGLSVSTPDGQASLVAPKGAFPPAAGQRSVLITITPSDPTPLGPSPADLVYQGNAYTFDARYLPSGEPAALVQPVSVLLQYPIHATVILRRDEQTWTRLRSTPVPASLQIFADTTKLGVFVAAGPKPATNRNLLPYISAGAILLAGVAGLIARRRQNRRREAAARPAASKKKASRAKPLPNRPKGKRKRR